jgi:hypothetical protein
MKFIISQAEIACAIAAYVEEKLSEDHEVRNVEVWYDAEHEVVQASVTVNHSSDPEETEDFK